MLSVSLITLGDPEQLTGGYLYHRRMAAAASAHDAAVRFVSFPQGAFPLPAWRGGAVMRDATAGGTDVVLVDSIAAAYAAPWLAGHRSRLPLAAILHQPPGGIDYRWLRTRVQARLDRSTYRHVALVVLASAALVDQLPSGLPVLDRPGGVLVVPPGRDVAAAPAGAADDLRRGCRAAFVSVGNWVHRKGTLELLDAFAALPAKAATLHLAGRDDADPRYAARVRARLAAGDLTDRVMVHGSIEPAEVAALYRDADAFVLPSLREPYGTVYGEAMAAGLPVVGWRAGNLPHLATHDREGVILPPGDVAGLTEALRRLAYDDAYRDRLAMAALTRAASFPTWAESAARLYAALRGIAA